MQRAWKVIIGGVFIAAGLTVAAFAHDGKHKEEEAKVITLQGELIDTACFVSSHGDAKGKDHAECATECLSSGIPAGILPEGSKSGMDMRFLLTNPKPLAQYAGQTIKVEAKSYEHVKAVDPQKVYVKDGAGWKEIKLNDAHHAMSEGGAAEKKKDGHAAQHGAEHGHK